MGQDLPGLGVLLDGEREQQALDGDEPVAGLVGRLLGGVEEPQQLAGRLRLGGRAGDLRLPGDDGVDLARGPRADLPPARSISPAAMPSGSSSSTLRICSGVNCGWPSRIAMVCAACRKPCARSV